MRLTQSCKSGGLLLAIGLVAGCGSNSAEPTDTTAQSDIPATEAQSEPTMRPPVEAPAATKVTSGDPIRGKGGLEEQCLAQVAEVTRAPVRGTNRIEESEAAIEIYVNVDGAEAPWKCLAYRDGTIAEVTYTGSEGAL